MRTLSTSTSAKLFATGFTVGPLVDSLHNQCLLRYGVLPISIEWPKAIQQYKNPLTDFMVSGGTDIDAMGSAVINSYPYFFCSSWVVPPLLGFAYVVLGGLLPRIVESILATLTNKITDENSSIQCSLKHPWSSPSSTRTLRTRALLAVTTTAMIIKLSEFLETHPALFDNYGIVRNHFEPASLSLATMGLVAIFQWALLDRSFAALLVATMTAIGGPLAELPFVGHGVWTYIEEAADYFPLQGVLPTMITSTAADNNLYLEILQTLFGTSSYNDLALSSITGPCYFVVAMDAIALGRWFDTSTPESIESDDTKV